MRDSFAVTMPGSITSHKGGVVSGNTVTYTVHYGEETDIDVVGSGLNTSVLIPIGAGAAIILLAIVGFIIWRRRGVASPNHPAMQAAYGGLGGQTAAQSWPTNPSMPPNTFLCHTNAPVWATFREHAALRSFLSDRAIAVAWRADNTPIRPVVARREWARCYGERHIRGL